MVKLVWHWDHVNDEFKNFTERIFVIVMRVLNHRSCLGLCICQSLQRNSSLSLNVRSRFDSKGHRDEKHSADSKGDKFVMCCHCCFQSEILNLFLTKVFKFIQLCGMNLNLRYMAVKFS